MTPQELALLRTPPKRHARYVPDEVVRGVRAMAQYLDGDEITQRTIARRYGISATVVNHIIHRKREFERR